tara:strand:+ start:11412 stop:11828 length:417 start_codon:yes stop_codon:yes gene_type:complete
MSNAMTDYFEAGLLNQIFRGQSITLPSTGVFIGLTSDYPGEATPTANELAGNGYARVHVPTGEFNAPVTAGSGQKVVNNAAITFPQASANWGYASGVIIADALSGGNVFFKGGLTTPRDVLLGDTFRFNTSDLDIKFD